MIIDRSIDIEDEVRKALAPYAVAVYCRPLPADYALPHIQVTQVGGTEANRVSTFDITLDARAENELAAMVTLHTAVAYLRAAAKNQTTAIRHIEVNSSGSWGNDPARPDLAMCSVRLQITAHLEQMEV